MSAVFPLNFPTHAMLTEIPSAADWDVCGQTSGVDPEKACFVVGTMIRTPDGECLIEDLSPGDLVMTRDNDAQPILFVGERTVKGTGRDAPVRFEAGAAQNSRALMVSPQHRMLVDDWRAQLFSGEEEAFCAAINLCDGKNIHQEACEEITYLHLMFAQHEVIYAEGCPADSCLVTDIYTESGEKTECEIVEFTPAIVKPGQRRRKSLPEVHGFETMFLTSV